MDFSKFSREEVERRRSLSIAAMQERERSEFEAWYQEVCDREYWTLGRCCAGCDHWMSSGGSVGQCSAAGIMSGDQVIKSMGISFSSLMPGPDFPYTKNVHVCGLFRDDFDWSSLPDDYLDKIGARAGGKLRDKPSHMIARVYRGKGE